MSIGLTVALLIYAYAQFEFSYDSFHKNADRIFRVGLSSDGGNTTIHGMATNHPAVGPALKADFPEVEEFARLVRASLFIPSATVTHDSGTGQPAIFNEERVYFADASFLSIFNFPVAEGNVETALAEPRTIVITESIAKKYFGKEKALGKILKLNRLECEVTAILKDLPENSHLKFDMLVSFERLGKEYGNAWDWPEFYNYILVNPSTNVQDLTAKLSGFLDKYVAKMPGTERTKASIFLQPLKEIHLKSSLRFEQSMNGEERNVYVMILVAIFVLFIGWINYINLSSAKALERSKEISLRKVAGASRTQLFGQFFVDSVVANLLSIVIAIAFLTLTFPFFESLLGKHILSVVFSSGQLLLSLPFWTVLILMLAFGIGIVGLFPALIVSSFNPAVVLKGAFIKSDKGIVLRKMLVGFQYVLSAFFISATVAIWLQIAFMKNEDLGYVKDQLLVVRAAGIRDSTYWTHVDFFKNELGRLADLNNVTSSGNVPGQPISEINTIRRRHQSEEENIVTGFLEIDTSFTSTYDLEFLAGRNYQATDQILLQEHGQDSQLSARQSNIMINAELATRLGFIKPEEALHQNVEFALGGKNYTAQIIGILKNYHQVSLKENYSPLVFIYSNRNFSKYLTIRIKPNGIDNTISVIKTAYVAAFPMNAFEYFFLNDHFNNQYQNDVQFNKLFYFFTALAIFISCLGLLGLALFAVNHRIKEIGIRKVLGSSTSRILILFSRESVWLIVVSYLLSLPLTYVGIQSWLNSFAFHIGLNWKIFLFAPCCLLTISILTTVCVSLGAARMNPANVLRCN